MMMQDPMANLGADTQGGDISANTKEFVDPLVMHVNMQRIERIRTIMGIASGMAAGICGLTSWGGFGKQTIWSNGRRISAKLSLTRLPLFVLACFLVLHVITNMTIWATKMNGDLYSYTKQSWFTFMAKSMEGTVLSFTLFWTMFYGLVYLF